MRNVEEKLKFVQFKLFIEIKGWFKDFDFVVELWNKHKPNKNLLVINRPPTYEWVFGVKSYA